MAPLQKKQGSYGGHGDTRGAHTHSPDRRPLAPHGEGQRDQRIG